MRAIISAIVVCILAGCYSPIPESRTLTGSEIEVAQRVYVAWSDAGLPGIDASCTIDRIRKAAARGERFEELCGRCEPGECGGNAIGTCGRVGCASACVRMDSYGPFYDVKRRPTFVYHETEDPRAVIVNELPHWLSFCAGRGWDWRDEDPALWGPGGVRDVASK